MKRLFTLVLLACFLLTTGCAILPENAPTAPTSPSSTETTQPSATDAALSTTATTVAPTTEAPTTTKATTKTTTKATTKATTTTTQAPVEMATVYLLEEATIFDSGRTVYHYDSDGNIVSLESLTLEEDVRYTQSFEEPDANGMPCKVSLEWPDDGGGYSYTIAYFLDGKINYIQENGYDTFTGYRYDYDRKGDLIEVEEYYDDTLFSRLVYEYDGETLTDMYCEDADGYMLYSGIIENGRIVSEHHYQDGLTIPYDCKYDKHGNLIEKTISADDIPYDGTFYSYKAIKVPADRAFCLQQQQRYLLSHT